ncbi:MAG: calcium/proton exchanger [Mycobacteriales bacterium]
MSLTRSDRLLFGAAVALIALAGLTHYADLGSVTAFACSGLAVALLAALVGRSVEQLGDRFGAGATGVLQSALGNLPELFIGIFALRAGLIGVVQAAIIGSILGNALLVLGLAFLVGGLRHGVQQFSSARARSTSVLLVLAVSALVVPSLAAYVHTPAASHEGTLSIIVSVVLLLVFALSLPAALRRAAPAQQDGGAEEVEPEPPRWPLPLALAVLAASSLLAALVSDWFVTALEPAIETLNISQAFAGLVIVAIAGNAVENVVGIQLAAKNRADYALSVIVNSPLQIALVLAPALVLLSHVVGGAVLTLVFSPMLVVAVALAVITVTIAIVDGESDWLEGAALLGLYGVIAASFWWG